MTKIRKLLSITLALAVAVLSVSLNVAVNAANFKGNGTMASPYIVETAEQLQSMRDNLSAHYKLGNTIDLTGVDFKPIGRLNTPFKGSFVCELNADKTPKYIIKNLKMNIADTPYAGENISKWEGGLFGATDGATISGIYVLNAEVTNQVFGDNTGSVAYGTYKPGMTEMVTGILIGKANNSVVTNCGVSGSVGGRGSYCGGIIGHAVGTTVENCYSTATLNTTGLWATGGFIGIMENSKVKSCFLDGNVTIGSSGAAFVGVIKGDSVSDCYIKGNAIRATGTNLAFVSDRSGGTYTNCIVYGTYPNSGIADNTTVNNCWAVQSDINKFNRGDINSIKSAFNGLSAWDVSGAEPRLKNVGIADASQYSPVSVTETPKESTSGNANIGGTSTTESDNAATTESKSAASVDEVVKMIEDLPDPTIEDLLTIDDKEAVMKAYNAYESLSSGEKEDFDATLFAKLSQCRYNMSLLMVGDIVKAINKLPTDKEKIAKKADEIISLYNDFAFLDDAVKAEIDQSKIDALENAYKIAKEAKDNPVMSLDTDNGKLTKMEKFIVIFGFCIVALAVAFDVFVGVMLLKKEKIKEY